MSDAADQVEHNLLVVSFMDRDNVPPETLTAPFLGALEKGPGRIFYIFDLGPDVQESAG
jgi:hypothetical protein